MQKAIIGKKIGMTKIFNDNGITIPVTIIEAGPCTITQIKIRDKDGYDAVQMGFCQIDKKKLSKPRIGHLLKSSDKFLKYLFEFKIDDINKCQLNDIITTEIFNVGESIDVTGTSKGKGFSGVIKRFNASRGPMSHGAGPVHRHQGSMGANSDPSKVMKGKMMPGHMGTDKVTIQNLNIIKLEHKLNLIIVKGAIPGPKNGIVLIKNTVKNK